MKTVSYHFLNLITTLIQLLTLITTFSQFLTLITTCFGKKEKKDFIQKFSTLMILRGEVKFFGQSQFYGSIHFHVKLIKVKFFQTCRYQGQKSTECRYQGQQMNECCYQGQKVIGQCYDDRRCVFVVIKVQKNLDVVIKVQNWLSVVIKDTFIFNRSRWPPIQFPMLLR